MKTNLLFPALLLILMIACDKDDNVNPGSSKLLKSYTYTSDTDTLHFTYNANKELTRWEDSYGRETFTESGNKLHYVYFRKNENRNVADAMFNLDGNRRIISGHGDFSYNLADPFTSDFTFEYDANGNLVKWTDLQTDGDKRSYEMTWQNGDMTKVKWIYDDSLLLTFNITYSNIEDKVRLDKYKFYFLTRDFFGNSSKHLLSHVEKILTPHTTSDTEWGFSYQMDNDGYPAKVFLNYITAVAKDTLEYHY